MQKLLPPILLAIAAIAAIVFSMSAPAADGKDRDRSQAGTGASSEGGASLGGTGIDSGVANPRGTAEPDKRIKLQKQPKPTEEPKDSGAERKRPDDRGNASAGSASRGSADLSEEADKQDEEFRKKQDAERRK